MYAVSAEPPLRNWSCPPVFKIVKFLVLIVVQINQKNNYPHLQFLSDHPLNQHARNQAAPLQLTQDLDEQINATVVARTLK